MPCSSLTIGGSAAVGAVTMAGMCGSIRTSAGSATSRRSEDCVQAREAWIAESRAALTQARDAAAQGYFHVRLSMKSQSRDEAQLDLSREDLETRILTPYRAGRPVVINGAAVPIDDLAQISIVRTERSCVNLRRIERPGSLIGRLNDTFTTDWGFVASAGEHVTNEFMSEPPGSTTMPVQAATLPLPTARYISGDIVTAIRGKAGQSKLDVAKLLALAEELNDNYARKNTYAARALLRAILDHIPPILGSAGFPAVASNYPWTQTDKRYMRKLLDFRDQADDALHRQISVKADVLTFDDMPASVCVNRLLQECASCL